MFEFDVSKSKANKIKHGINFDEAKNLWLENSVVLKSKHLNEERWMLIAPYMSSLWVAVFTIRFQKIRIISVRKARLNEKKYYDQEKI